MTLHIVRSWVVRFDGGAPKANFEDRHRRALEEAIATGPIAAVQSLGRRRIVDLAQRLR